jgi:hypothetical protein
VGDDVVLDQVVVGPADLQPDAVAPTGGLAVEAVAGDDVARTVVKVFRTNRVMPSSPLPSTRLLRMELPVFPGSRRMPMLSLFTTLFGDRAWMFPWTMLLFVLATIPTLLAIPVWTTAASGAVLSCGQTITQNTVLDNDLTGCTNNGIVIGADNITLNLNGHIISGTPNTGDQAGVALVGRTGGTVRNGTVRAFDVGVVIEGGSGNTVQAIQAIGNISFENAPRRGGDGIAILS